MTKSHIITGGKGTSVIVEKLPKGKISITPSVGRKVIRKYRLGQFVFKDELFDLPPGF